MRLRHPGKVAEIVCMQLWRSNCRGCKLCRKLNQAVRLQIWYFGILVCTASCILCTRCPGSFRISYHVLVEAGESRHRNRSYERVRVSETLKNFMNSSGEC